MAVSDNSLSKLSKSESHQKSLFQRKSILILFSLILLLMSGCQSLDETKQKYFGGEEKINSTPQVNTVTVDPAVYKPEKFSYCFKDAESCVFDFIKYSQEFVYCSFPDVKDDDFVVLLKLKYDDPNVDTKLLFDKLSAFTNCETSCVPRPDSKWNSLFAYGVDMKPATQNTKFCANEKGAVWFSTTDSQFTEAHLFYNKQVGEIYKEKFLSQYK